MLRVVEQEQQQQKPSVTDRVKAYLGRQCLERARPLIGGKALRKVVCHGRALTPAARRLFTALGIQIEVISGSPPSAFPLLLQRSAATVTDTTFERLRRLASGGKASKLPKALRRIPNSPPRPLAGLRITPTNLPVNLQADTSAQQAREDAGPQPSEPLEPLRRLRVAAHPVLVGAARDAAGGVEELVEAESMVLGDVIADGAVLLAGTADELVPVAAGDKKGVLQPSRIEEFVLRTAPLIRQACAVLDGAGAVVLVAVPDLDALFEMHQARTGAEFKLSPAHLLQDYTLRERCERQLDHVLHVLRADPSQVAPSAIPAKYILVSEEFSVAAGTLSPLSLLEPRRDAIARLHVAALRQ